MAEIKDKGERAAAKAEDVAAARQSGDDPSVPKDTVPSSDPIPAGNAMGSPAAQAGRPVPTAAAEPFSLKASEAIDPRTGEDFDPGKPQGGVSGFELLEGDAIAVPGVNPDRIPVEVTHGVSPDAGGNKLLAAAQAAAPSLTQEFVDTYKLDDEVLGRIARREIPPPPTNGPLRTSDLYLTPGGWQSVPPGQNPEDVGKNSISR